MSDVLLSVQLNSGRAYLLPRSLLVRLVRADPERVLLLIAEASDPADGRACSTIVSTKLAMRLVPVGLFHNELERRGSFTYPSI